MTFLSQISFMDLCCALVAMGVIERLLLLLAPDWLVGPHGVLIRTAE